MMMAPRYASTCTGSGDEHIAGMGMVKGEGEGRTHHQQSLTKRARSLPQHLVRTQRDDVAQAEDERVHVFHVEVVGGYCIGDGVLC